MVSALSSYKDNINIRAYDKSSLHYSLLTMMGKSSADIGLTRTVFRNGIEETLEITTESDSSTPKVLLNVELILKAFSPLLLNAVAEQEA